MRFDPDRHRRSSIRLAGHDYAGSGTYFVTLCLHGRQPLFGELHHGTMRRNGAGEKVASCWRDLTNRFTGIMLDTFVVMPDHFHGIIHLGRGEPCVRPAKIRVESEREPFTYPTPKCTAMADGIHPTSVKGEHKVRPYGTADGSLGRIVQAFKSITTRSYIDGVRRNGWPGFEDRLWQRNYWERIIRSEAELHVVRAYIRDNPRQASDD